MATMGADTMHLLLNIPLIYPTFILYSHPKKSYFPLLSFVKNGWTPCSKQYKTPEDHGDEALYIKTKILVSQAYVTCLGPLAFQYFDIEGS